MEEGYVLDAFAVNYAQHLIVCGVHGKSSRLLFFQFGVSTPVQIIEGTLTRFLKNVIPLVIYCITLICLIVTILQLVPKWNIRI